MKPLFFTLCLALVGLLPAQAQQKASPFTFHAKAGIGSSYFHGPQTGDDTRLAYKIGIGAEYHLGAYQEPRPNRCSWSLASALEFASIGGKEAKGYGEEICASMNELYLQIPLQLKARLHFSEHSNASLGIGPYVAVGVGGMTSGTVTDRLTSNPDNSYRFRLRTFGSTDRTKMGNRRFDTGLTFALTFEYHSFLIGADIQWGLFTVNKQLGAVAEEYEGYLPKNFASFLTVGYRLWQ